jgi:hypothetical protein
LRCRRLERACYLRERRRAARSRPRQPSRAFRSRLCGELYRSGCDGVRHGVVRLTCVGQQELEAECAFTLRQLHSAIRSPPRLGRSAALILRRDGVEG